MIPGLYGVIQYTHSLPASAQGRLKDVLVKQELVSAARRVCRARGPRSRGSRRPIARGRTVAECAKVVLLRDWLMK
jgi:hypothetical protein